MLEETHSISASFVATALLHEIVSPRDAERIAAYAEENSVSQSEAALDLTVLSSQQVDAVRVLLRPTNLAPGYQIKSLLGCGAMGMVFRARQASLDRDVALKTILLRKTDDQRERARFQREAHAIARLQHPHIVAAYDAGIHEGRAFIAMELVDGEDLASRLRSRGVFSEGEAWRIARQVAEALAHADAMGIVHRDVKPANIMLARNAGGGESDAGPLIAKVTDFGLSLWSDENDQVQMTATGATLGTPAYVAPEQLEDTHVDGRADIYALGATLFHMLTGKTPYADVSPIKAILAKTSGDDAWRQEIKDYCQPISADLIFAMTETRVEDRVSGYAELMG
ncbi:MAG: serine/threonine-protein kinase, partial [Planctomycetota bacterium]